MSGSEREEVNKMNIASRQVYLPRNQAVLRTTESPVLWREQSVGKASRRKQSTIGYLFLTFLFRILVSGATLSRPCLAWKSSSWPSWINRNRNRNRNRNSIRRNPSCPTHQLRQQTHDATRRSLTTTASFVHDDGISTHQDYFPTHRPLLAIITESDACDSEEKARHTLEAIRAAVTTHGVDLVSVRLSLPPPPSGENDKGDNGNGEHYHGVLERARVLTEQLVRLSAEQGQQRKIDSPSSGSPTTPSDTCSNTPFRVVCSSDLVSVAVEARAHGVHVKEHHLDRLPEILEQFDYPIVVGTSTHSVESALVSCLDGDVDSGVRGRGRVRPHYYFVGTCYLTASHPEKTSEEQLEGPELPGRVRRALLERLRESPCDAGDHSGTRSDTRTGVSETNTTTRMPRVFAIGGIDATNCHHPVAFGADGVAVIRAVLQTERPSEAVQQIQDAMTTASASARFAEDH